MAQHRARGALAVWLGETCRDGGWSRPIARATVGHVTAVTGLPSSARETSRRPAPDRMGIASLPPPVAANPYQRLLYEQLERHGLRLEPVDRLRATWLWSARRTVGRLHFHWPQVYYHDPRLGGAVSWLRLPLFAGRLGAARVLGYRIAWTVHQVDPHESPSRRLRSARRAPSGSRERRPDRPRPGDGDGGRPPARPAPGVHVLAHPAYAGAYSDGRTRAAVRASLGLSDGAFTFLCFGTSALQGASACCSPRSPRRCRRHRADRRRRAVDPAAAAAVARAAARTRGSSPCSGTFPTIASPSSRSRRCGRRRPLRRRHGRRPHACVDARAARRFRDAYAD